MDPRDRFGYAFLVFALGDGIATIESVIRGASTLDVGLGVLVVVLASYLGVAYLTGRAGEDVDSLPRWFLLVGPPVVALFGLVIGLLSLQSLLAA